MQAAFLTEAVKYNVLPLDDRTQERFNPAIAGRPDLLAGHTSLTVYSGMIGMKENAFINIKNHSYSVAAELEVPKTGVSGVILAQGGVHAGWSLYINDDKPKFAYNYLGNVSSSNSTRPRNRQVSHEKSSEKSECMPATLRPTEINHQTFQRLRSFW
jgi:hypothetical protein